MVGKFGAARRGQVLRQPGCSRRVAGCVQLAALALAVLDDPVVTAEEGLSDQSYGLPFPFLEGELAAAFQLDALPHRFLDALLDDALQLHAQSGLLRPGVSVRHWQPKTKPRRFSIEQLIEVVSSIDFPDGVPAEIEGAEYWVEVRKNGGRDGNNAFLFDKDVGYATNQQQMRFPALSTMTFLTDGGAPTIILNRTTDITGSHFVPAVPSQGYLTVPTVGKHLRFNSRAQHGLLGEGCSSSCDEDVVVIRINWWAHKAPEPPYCKRLSKTDISETGYTVFDKAEVQQIKSEIGKSKLIPAIQSETLLAESLPTTTVTLIMPPVCTNGSFACFARLQLFTCPIDDFADSCFWLIAAGCGAHRTP